MTDNFYIITKKDLFDLFERFSKDHRVFVPYAKGDRLHFEEFDPKKEDLIELGGIRQSQPFKSFLNPAREKVLPEKLADNRPMIIAGVKACDLASLAVQDFVFLKGECEDPFYSENRANTIIIASDCTYARETCFCLAMEGAPYPKVNFDISISAIDDFFLAEVSTDKGRQIINDFKTFFSACNPRYINIRQSNRDVVTGQVRDFIQKRGTKSASEIKGAIAKNYDNLELWKDSASTCVECGACNLVCPTCHCFMLYDEKQQDKMKRMRIWDSCLYNTFARVAGGANPRRHLYERLRNRFDKKFEFFPQVMNYTACTGCGRCVEACPGNIDIREVLKGAVLGKWEKPPHK